MSATPLSATRSHSNTLRLTVLGSGTSMGVPTIGCRCEVCTSTDPRDNRMRVSVLLSRNAQNVLIDTTPDFRSQALRAGIEQIEAVLLTHGHADHVMGFDDLRPLSIGQKRPMPVYSNAQTFSIIKQAFSYAFDGRPKLSSVPSVLLWPQTSSIGVTPVCSPSSRTWR